MLVAPPLSYPGVYIQEVPSDVRTIIGVDTATTAFVGRAIRGPVNVATVINTYADFERIFGGLWIKSSLGYAVQDFFLNGGSKAVIVRVFRADGEDAAANAAEKAALKAAARAEIDANGLELTARSPGAWGNELAARITNIATDAEVDNPNSKKGQVAISVAARYPGVTAKDIFTLTIRDLATGTTEVFENVTANVGPRQVKDVLAQGSALVEISGGAPTARPSAHKIELDPAFDSVWEDPATHSGVDIDSETDSGKDGVKPDGSEDVVGSQANKTGIYALENTNIFNLLCIPPFDGEDVGDMKDVDPAAVLAPAAKYCKDQRAMLIVDAPYSPPTGATYPGWTNKKNAVDGFPIAGLPPTENAAIYFPRIKKPNPLRDNQIEPFAPCGAIAGIIARTDATRGVWKAPAGLDASLTGVVELSVPLTDAENGELNPLGVNCLRALPAAGNLVWGARTLVGDDRLASQWKYVPVRRTALYIEETIYRNIQWAVFEPNDEPLWSQLRLNLGVFMHGLFRQGAFQGGSPKDAYFVKCDATTTPQADIDKGIVNVVVGFAPLKPAEFVVVYIQQIAGQLAA